MARLCKEINSHFSEFVLKNLNLRGIFTTIDFLEENPDKLVNITKLSSKDILDLRQSIISNFSAFPSNGKMMHKEVTAHSTRIRSSIVCLDELLGGGFATRNIYEICGPSGSCKTQLCLSIATNISLYLEQKVFYIDAKLDFSSRRIFSILEEKKVVDHDIADTLKRIEVMRTENIFDLFAALNTLHKRLSQQELETPVLKVIIIDSISTLFFPFLNDSCEEGNVLKNQLACTMKQIASECYISFILVNLASKYTKDVEMLSAPDEVDVRAKKGSLNPALGKHWIPLPNTRLLLTKDESKVKVTVVKSTDIRRDTSCILTINAEGLV